MLLWQLPIYQVFSVCKSQTNDMFRLCLEFFTKCPSEVFSYARYCYVTLRDDMSSADSRDACEQLGGALLWLDDVAELVWLEPVLEGYDVNCTHLGKTFSMDIL